MAKKIKQILNLEDVTRLPGETDEELIGRVTQLMEDLGGWTNVGIVLNRELGTNFTSEKYRKSKYCKHIPNENRSEASKKKTSEEMQAQAEEIRLLKEELQKERYKIQTEKLEYNRSLREQARDELIVEKITDAIESLEPLQFIINNSTEKGIGDNKEYCLIISDMHYGCEFKIPGLFGETIAEYSPEIFATRMRLLLQKVCDIIDKEGIKKLRVFNLGDDIDGCLRVSQLWKLRYGVVDSTIKYAEYISNWLNVLSSKVEVEYSMVIDGNHSQLRMLGQPKNTFKEDNMSKIIASFIKERLKDNDNFKFIENETGLIFTNIAGYNILGFHGECRKMEKAISDFSNIYNVDIDYLIAGHMHHCESKEIGRRCEVINAPSIIGMDDFALSIKRSSSAAAKLLGFEEGLGKTVEHTIVLDATKEILF